jgi:hypothetical protein
LTRLADTSEDAPQGCVFVVDRIAKAEEVFVDLDKFLPGHVAIWTSDHDKSGKSGSSAKVKNPSARHDVDELVATRWPS